MIKRKVIKLFIAVIFPAFLLISCYKQEARKPISRNSGSFLRESVDRNKALIAKEEASINTIIKSNPKIQYITSTKGYWYYYENKTNDLNAKTPIRGDVAFFDYEIKDLSGNVIYTSEELKPQVYYIDKENIITGLRDGIKLMKKGEKISFLFPSHMAYGYHGDTKKIGSNTPLLYTVTLHDIKPETEIKQ